MSEGTGIILSPRKRPAARRIRRLQQYGQNRPPDAPRHRLGRPTSKLEACQQLVQLEASSNAEQGATQQSSRRARCWRKPNDPER